MSVIYRSLTKSVDKFVPSKLRPLWEHEAGPKTIFFWAPAFKWTLVMTSIDDFRRPIEKVSPTTSASLAATGIVWTRYCLVIKPINYALSLCNLTLGLANSYQCYRALSYQWGLKNDNVAQSGDAALIVDVAQHDDVALNKRVAQRVEKE